MGFFSKIFKGVKKVFTGIGKVIKKAFTAVGKFTNKLGIVGQIGMMFVAPAIAGWAMKGLTHLGSGFMTGGFMTGLETAAQGTGLLSGAARVTHGILSTVANVASSGMKIFNNISENVTGAIGNITEGLKNMFKLPSMDPSTILETTTNILDRNINAFAPKELADVVNPYADVVDPFVGAAVGPDTTFSGIPSDVEIKQIKPDTFFSTQPGDTKNWTQGIFDNSLDTDVRYGTKLPPAKHVSAAVQKEEEEEGFVSQVFRQTGVNLLTDAAKSLMAPTPEPVEEPVNYAMYVPETAGLVSLKDMAIHTGSGATLDYLTNVNVGALAVGDTWNNIISSNPDYIAAIRNPFGYFGQLDASFNEFSRTGVTPTPRSNLVG